MNFKGVRYPIILAVLALVLAVLFGGRWLYESQTMDRPLEQAIRSVPGVSDVRVVQRGDTVEVRVKAGDAGKLEEFVAQLWRAIDANERTRRVELRLSDSRVQALEDAYYSFHFSLQEAMATGLFSELPARLAEAAKPDVVGRSRIYVGTDYVYVQLHQGDAALYEIVPRSAAASGSATAGATPAVPRLVTVAPWGD